MTDAILDLVDEIERTLLSELPTRHHNLAIQFRDFAREERYRAAFAILDQACRLSDWHPPVKLLGLREKFMVVF